MWDIRAEIYSAAQQYHIRAIEISANDTSDIISKVSDKFASGYLGRFLWDYLKPCFAYHDKDSWKYIEDFPDASSCYMFFDPHDSDIAFEIPNLRDVVRIVSESIAFEFYVTNPQLDYIFAFGHEDVLIACGSAAEWLRQRVQTGSAE